MPIMFECFSGHEAPVSISHNKNACFGREGFVAGRGGC